MVSPLSGVRLAGLALSSLLLVQPTAVPATAYVHVELHNGRGDVVRDATVVVRGDSIEAVREGDATRSGERRVDASGLVMIPGLIDADSALLAGQGFNYERDQAVMPNLRVQDGIDSIDRMVAGAAQIGTGLTFAYLSPGAWRPIGGQGLLVRLDGQTLLDMRVPATSFVHLSINEGPLFTYGRGGTLPQTHMGIVEMIRESLVRARTYREARSRSDTEARPAYDPDLEVLADVLSGARTARFDADTAHDIQRAIALADEFGIRPVLEHCVQAYKVRDLLATRRFPVILTPFTQGDVFDLDEERQMLETPGWLAAHGVPVAFETFGHGMPPYSNVHEYNEPRSLLLDGILQVRAGMASEEVLRAMTSTPAAILGIGDREGSLEPGKRATFVLLDGQPFEYASQVREVWVDGRRAWDARTQTVFYR